MATFTLPRFHRRQEEAAELMRAGERLIESGVAAPVTDERLLSALGCERQARGVPVCTRGVGGVSAGTHPLAALMAKQPREE